MGLRVCLIHCGGNLFVGACRRGVRRALNQLVLHKVSLGLRPDTVLEQAMRD